GDADAVVADSNFDDVLDAVLLAVREFALLYAARRVGRVRMRLANAGTEQLHAAAGAGRFNDRSLDTRSLAELLCDRGRERISGRRSDDANLIARLGRAGNDRSGRRERKCAGEGLEFQGTLLLDFGGCSDDGECLSSLLGPPLCTPRRKTAGSIS